MLASWKPENAIRRMFRAEHSSPSTWPVSRHARTIGINMQTRQGREYIEDLMRYPADASDAGVSIIATVELLYKSQIEIARLKAKVAALESKA